MAVSVKFSTKKLENNPWYLLATLYGDLKKDDHEYVKPEEEAPHAALAPPGRATAQPYHDARIFRFALKFSLRVLRNSCQTPTRTIGNPMYLSRKGRQGVGRRQIHYLESLVFR